MHEALETERLRLRMFRDDDLDAYFAICSDPEVMEFIGQGKTMNRLDTWRQIAVMLGHWYLRGYGSWAVEEKASGKLVGRVGFINPAGWPGLELGWALGRARGAWVTRRKLHARRSSMASRLLDSRASSV